MGKLWYIDESGKRKRTKAGIHHELIKYQSSAKAKAERAARNSARRSAIRRGVVKKGDGLEVDHKDSSPLHNSADNLRVVSRKTNRSKKENSRRRGSRRSKSSWGL